jgi:hypothetical protein
VKVEDNKIFHAGAPFCFMSGTAPTAEYGDSSDRFAEVLCELQPLKCGVWRCIAIKTSPKF